jgi:Pyruvate/2-oxoacid:ferredoxin oxidoreductase delta subunit
MLTDLNLALRSHFSLMDAIVGMEGPGPGSGYPRTLGLVLASRDPLALDMTACRAIGLDPHLVANLEDALGRGVWIKAEDEIELLGPSIAEVAVADWKQVPRQAADRKIPPAFRNLFVSRPFFSRTRCSACKACVTICPGAALELVPDPQARAKKSVRVDYDKCIRCYCCHEVCADEAIVVKRWRPLGFA